MKCYKSVRVITESLDMVRDVNNEIDPTSDDPIVITDMCSGYAIPPDVDPVRQPEYLCDPNADLRFRFGVHYWPGKKTLPTLGKLWISTNLQRARNTDFILEGHSGDRDPEPIRTYRLDCFRWQGFWLDRHMRNGEWAIRNSDRPIQDLYCVSYDQGEYWVTDFTPTGRIMMWSSYGMSEPIDITHRVVYRKGDE